MAQPLTDQPVFQEDEVQILDEPTSAGTSKDLLQLALETAEEGLATDQPDIQEQSEARSKPVENRSAFNQSAPDFNPDNMLLPEHLREEPKSASAETGTIEIKGT